jgi:hypothetical protein
MGFLWTLSKKVIFSLATYNRLNSGSEHILREIRGQSTFRGNILKAVIARPAARTSADHRCGQRLFGRIDVAGTWFEHVL